MPDSLGNAFTIRCFGDADHAENLVTRRSRTGFVVLLNNETIYWHTKKQGSKKTNTLGSEFMTMDHAAECGCSLRYAQTKSAWYPSGGTSLDV